MKVKEILAEVAYKIGRGDLAEEVNGEENEERRELLSCYNEVEKNVALEFFALQTEETFQVKDGKIPFTSFSKKPSSVDKVKNEEGEELPYELFSSYLAVKEKRVVVRYSFVPENKDWEEECELAFSVPRSAVVAGVLCGYYLSRGMLSESSVWNKTYYSLLRSAKEKNRKSGSLPARRWV